MARRSLVLSLTVQLTMAKIKTVIQQRVLKLIHMEPVMMEPVIANVDVFGVNSIDFATTSKGDYAFRCALTALGRGDNRRDYVT